MAAVFVRLCPLGPIHQERKRELEASEPVTLPDGLGFSSR